MLYPGCSIHITPSFFFPHVIYVDSSPVAQAFFADRQGVLAYVNSRKTYRSPAHLRFLAQDYTRALPLEPGRFDLVVSLFAGDIARNCSRYLKRGGLLLTNNHHGDAAQAAALRDLELISVIRFRRKDYVFVDELPGDRLPRFGPPKTERYLKSSSNGLTYVENDEYFVFQCRPYPRIPGRRSP